MQAKFSKEEVNATKEPLTSELWYWQLGYINQKRISILAKKNALPINGSRLKTYESYLMGKQIQIFF